MTLCCLFGITRCVPTGKNFLEAIYSLKNPLLTKLVRSSWLDIDLVLFWVFMDLASVSVPKHVEKKLANIQPSSPHVWSIAHMY